MIDIRLPHNGWTPRGLVRCGCGTESHRRSIEGYGFILDIEIAYKFCVRGDEIVDAIHFNAVTGVINHGYIGISRSLGKFAEDAPKSAMPRSRSSLTISKPTFFQVSSDQTLYREQVNYAAMRGTRQRMVSIRLRAYLMLITPLSRLSPRRPVKNTILCCV